jgi:hypothetical protein
MLTQVRRKIVQKNIKKYSELRIRDWYSMNFFPYLWPHSNLGNQRYSKEAMSKSFANSKLIAKIPYYNVGEETYNLILCPSGSFWKGSNIKMDDNPLEEKKIEEPFLLGETEITQELYYAVMDTNPSEFKNNPKNPVENVSWYDAVMFCNKMSDKLGLERYYTITRNRKTVDTIEQKKIM